MVFLSAAECHVQTFITRCINISAQGAGLGEAWWGGGFVFPLGMTEVTSSSLTL
jgi:hypothetical protein